ncbi:MAG: hypothetical protein IID05_03035 [Gemmatimonadetes bacterium]|nr:hypothetical protein [Gemmatimonadota bacterium]
MADSEIAAKGKKPHGGVRVAMPSVTALMRWVYVGRVSVAITIFVAASFYFAETPPGVIVTVAVAAVLSLIVTGASIFHTHIRGVVPGPNFLYAQNLFDLGLVTTVVHVTGGVNSDFASLYILIIAVSAVTMPIASSLLVTITAAVLYVADVVLMYPGQLSIALWLQVGVFVAVAVATGYLASRVRVVGAAGSELEQEVKRLRLEAADILRQIGSGVITVAGDGSLVFANWAAERLLAFVAAEYVGRPFMEYLNGVAPEIAIAIDATRGEGGRRLRVSGWISTPNEKLPIGVTTTLHQLGEETPSVTAIFTDISDQIRLEELNRRQERLEAVAELSASLAHEIKNPLASIRSSVEQLAASVHVDPDDRFLSQLVVRESDRLSRLLTEFLEFSRVRVAASEPVDLAVVARTAVAVACEHPDYPPGARVTVTGHCQPIPGDEDLLHRVVLNLVLNALQAADGAVEVRVTIQNAEARDLPSPVSMGSWVLLEVRDTGPGIPASLMDRLFDPFVTGREGGTGLGLSVVQRAVEAHGGLVFVDSESGAETVFSVFLPRTKRAEVAA